MKSHWDLACYCTHYSGFRLLFMFKKRIPTMAYITVHSLSIPHLSIETEKRGGLRGHEFISFGCIRYIQTRWLVCPIATRVK
jgi:hypothetical protein